MPLPPDTTILAAVKSGLSDSDKSLFTNELFPLVKASGPLTISASPPSVWAASNAVDLTVINFTLSRDFTVASALPA